jgi:hypothetical protein
MLKQWQNMGLTTIINDASTVWMIKKIMKPMEMGGVGNQYTTSGNEHKRIRGQKAQSHG